MFGVYSKANRAPAVSPYTCSYLHSNLGPPNRPVHRLTRCSFLPGRTSESTDNVAPHMLCRADVFSWTRRLILRGPCITSVPQGAHYSFQVIGLSEWCTAAKLPESGPSGALSQVTIILLFS